MNQVALVGNITDDPELRYTQSGAALAGFTVAVSHRRWVPSSVGSASQTATSTASVEEQNGNSSS
jgi:single-stranded DNA-binding protein